MSMWKSLQCARLQNQPIIDGFGEKCTTMLTPGERFVWAENAVKVGGRAAAEGEVMVRRAAARNTVPSSVIPTVCHPARPPHRTIVRYDDDDEDGDDEP